MIDPKCRVERRKTKRTPLLKYFKRLWTKHFLISISASQRHFLFVCKFYCFTELSRKKWFYFQPADLFKWDCTSLLGNRRRSNDRLCKIFFWSLTFLYLSLDRNNNISVVDLFKIFGLVRLSYGGVVGQKWFIGQLFVVEKKFRAALVKI